MHDLYPVLLYLLSYSAANSLRLLDYIIFVPIIISIHISKLNLQLIHPSLQLFNLFLVPILQHQQLLIAHLFLTTINNLIVGLLRLLAPIQNTQRLVVLF